MLEENKSYLDLAARKDIYDSIKKSPGLHFRELQRRTKLATGSIDYHLHFLHRHGLIRTEKTSRFVRYYPADQAFDEKEKELLNLLRQEKIRHILIHIIQNKRPNALKIANDLAISPSSLSWYLKKLAEKNIILQKKVGRFRYYSVYDKKKIILCLIAYKTSFVDDVVDSFIKAWE
ncbi:MAG: winged helix-turn-helix transcriptional regulator [Candidatus Aenigmatarchaeota archaeon]